MSETRLPTVATARHVLQKGKLDGVLIIAFGDGKFSTASYGATKAQCATLKRLNEFVFNAINSGRVKVTAFDSEDCPWPGITQ